MSCAAKFNWDKAQVAQCQDKYASTAPAGSFRPNSFGLRDVHGNAWTWVEDCFVDTYAKASKDGRKAPDTERCSRVLRGGSWNYDPQDLRSANRYRSQPDIRNLNIGFRFERTLNPTP